MRKGQAALEFLMTYGWAILVVLAAIAALAYFGVLSPDRFIPPKCTITGGFSCVEYKVSTGGSVLIAVQNNLGVDASSVVVNLTSTDCGGITVATRSQSVNSGANFANGEKSTPALTYVCTGTMGNKFKGDITISYVRSGETVGHTASGTISSTAE